MSRCEPYGPALAHRRAGPADEAEAIVAAEEQIVGDVEIAGAGVLGPDACAHVFEAAILHRESDGAQHFFLAGEDRDVGVAKREAVEDVIARRHHVEQPRIAVAVEDDFAVAGRLDGDRLFFRALERQRHRAVERRHHRVDVVEPLGFVEADVDEDGVAGLRAALPHDAPVAEAGAVVRLKHAREAGLDSLALVVGRVDVERAAFFRRHGLGARRDLDDMGRLAGRAVGVGELETALVLGAGREIQD